MKRKSWLFGLLAGATLLPLQLHAATTLTAQSYVPGTVVNDSLPVAAGRLTALAAQGVAIRPAGLPVSRFQSQRPRAATAQAAGPLAPPVDGCADIQIGAVYNAPTATAGQLVCAQFVTADATKTVAYVVNLPANEQHNVQLVQANADGTLTALDTDASTQPGKIVEGIVPGPVRLLLLVDSQQGAGGATFQFQVNNSTGCDAYEPNDALRHATPLSGNVQISANLDTVGDFDYYAVTVPAGQTGSLITFNGAGTQTAQLLTTPTTWSTLPAATSTNVTSTAGATLLLRVYNTATSAPAAQAYTLRVSDGQGTAGIYQFLDTENITHLVPNRVNVARTINVGVGAWDRTGNVRLPAGERVTVQASEQDAVTGNWRVLATTTAYTGANGQVLVPLNIGDCVASGTQTGDYYTRSVPADHWRINYNPNAKVEVTTDSELKTRASTTNFIHICREFYLGRNK